MPQYTVTTYKFCPIKEHWTMILDPGWTQYAAVRPRFSSQNHSYHAFPSCLADACKAYVITVLNKNHNMKMYRGDAGIALQIH